MTLPGEVALVAVPLALYFLIMFFSTFTLATKNKVKREEAISLAFTATGNNFELAIAVAVGVFGIASPEAFAAVIGPLIEVPMMLVLVKFVQRR